MKTLVNTLFAAFTLTVFSFTASVAEPHKPIGRPQKAAAFQSGMYPTTDSKLHVAIDKQIGSPVVVQLKNNAGTTLFVQQIGKNQATARLRMDVSNLPDGEYQVVISNGAETTTQNVTLATQKPDQPTRQIAIQ
ncbi:hypothetical protein ACO2Q8_12960 [Larkinella sp. VNQ87]|uniref:hypothetical protein n=1 Tax=Larkinella sp. VNQ87 TaxID=3400921 RepID=UPI003C0EA117